MPSKAMPGEKFMMLPEWIQVSEVFRSLSHVQRALYIDIRMLFNGSNNGQIRPSQSVMRKLGWKSRDVLSTGTEALVQAGLIVRTSQGGFYRGNTRASRFALCDQPIKGDASSGIESAVPTLTPENIVDLARRNRVTSPSGRTRTGPSHGQAPVRGTVIGKIGSGPKSCPPDGRSIDIYLSDDAQSPMKPRGGRLQ